MNIVKKCSAIDLLKSLSDSSVDVIYTDPPFGTGDKQTLAMKKKGKVIKRTSYVDEANDDSYLEFIVPHLVEMHRVLKQTGTLYIHLDYRWVHYVKVELDKIFGRDNFLNEIIWSYNLGGRSKDRWPKKHDNILVYAKEEGKHKFRTDEIDRLPYKAPAVQLLGRSKEEAAKRVALGQIPTDVWDMTFSNTDSQRLGYPSQKPLKLVRRCIVASSEPGDLVVDPFAGSGTTARAAHDSGRSFVVCDKSDPAIETMRGRFADLIEKSLVTFEV